MLGVQLSIIKSAHWHAIIRAYLKRLSFGHPFLVLLIFLTSHTLDGLVQYVEFGFNVWFCKNGYQTQKFSPKSIQFWVR